MNFNLLYISLFLNCFLYSQDYSDKWNEHYSYLNITGISSNGEEVLASAENAIFKHNLSNTENTKTSSIQGLTGEKISTYYYSDVYDTSVIGYENGLIEIVSPEGILSVVDILNKQSIAPNIKKINHIYELNDDVYLSCDFGIVKYNLDRLEFVDTYLIGNTGDVISVKQTTTKDEYIYAATDEGIKRAIYSDSNIIDFSLWETISTSSTNWKSIVTFDNDIYAINSSNSLYYDFNGVTFESQFNLAESILDHRVSENKMLITSNSASRVYERPFNNILTINNQIEYNSDFTVATLKDDELFIGTNSEGILRFNF